MTDETRETRLKRLKIRAWRRGTKEMDLLLGPFADGPLRDLPDSDLDAFEAMMEENDNDLYLWVSGEQSAPAYHDILAKIRHYHKLT